MKKKVICIFCEGTGKVEKTFCDKCGDTPVGNFEGKDLCLSCWDSETKEITGENK